MRTCSGDVSERLHLGTYQACGNDVVRDLLARGGGPEGTLGRVAARCDDCLISRLQEWYEEIVPCDQAAFADGAWSIHVRPYDPLFVDPDEQDDIESLQEAITQLGG